MKKILTAGGRDFEFEKMETHAGGIIFTQAGGSADEMAAFFSGVSELHTSLETEESGRRGCGDFGSLRFERASVNADGTVDVAMRILPQQEIEMEALKASQAEQDEMLAGLMYGG